MFDFYDYLSFVILFVLITMSPIITGLLILKTVETRKLKKKIKLYEEELFISNKDLASNEDFIKALLSLDDEFPG